MKKLDRQYLIKDNKIKIFYVILFFFFLSNNFLYVVNNSRISFLELTPAAAVMLCVILNKSESYPKRTFHYYLCYISIYIFFCCLSSLIPILLEELYYFRICSILGAWGFVLCIRLENKDMIEKWNLGFGNIRTIVVYSFIYIIVRHGMFLLSNIENLSLLQILIKFRSISFVNTCILYSTTFLYGFGEEYGWRFFLQPILQKRYGKYFGIIVLGLIWSVWHTNFYKDDFLIYILPSTISCICISFIFAYIYEQIKSIWGIAFIHFIHNQIGSNYYLAGDVNIYRLTLSIFILTIPFLILYRKQASGVKESNI